MVDRYAEAFRACGSTSRWPTGCAQAVVTPAADRRPSPSSEEPTRICAHPRGACGRIVAYLQRRYLIGSPQVLRRRAAACRSSCAGGLPGGDRSSRCGDPSSGTAGDTSPRRPGLSAIAYAMMTSRLAGRAAGEVTRATCSSAWFVGISPPRRCLQVAYLSGQRVLSLPGDHRQGACSPSCARRIGRWLDRMRRRFVQGPRNRRLSTRKSAGGSRGERPSCAAWDGWGRRSSTASSSTPSAAC